MKRQNNLYVKVCSIENLIAADQRARKGKKKQPGVIKHDQRRGCNILLLHNMLMEKSYKTSEYYHFRLNDPKPRDISGLPYWPDRIAQHALMSVAEPVFTACFTADSYSCIKGKGVQAAHRGIKKALRNKRETEFCLQIDVTKFYPSIDHDILKYLLRRKFKDKDFLWLLDEIIDSAPGVPIGNFVSQYFANYYLNGLDHWLKEVKRVKYYFRYADDLVFFSHNKQYLHQLRSDIQEYMAVKLNLIIKSNYRVFPMETGLNVLGYVYRPTHVRLRKRNKQNLAKAVKRSQNRQSIAGHLSLAVHCDSRHLLKKLNLNEYSTNKKL